MSRERLGPRRRRPRHERQPRHARLVLEAACNPPDGELRCGVT
jgi:hypothetical protein